MGIMKAQSKEVNFLANQKKKEKGKKYRRSKSTVRWVHTKGPVATIMHLGVVTCGILNRFDHSFDQMHFSQNSDTS